MRYRSTIFACLVLLGIGVPLLPARGQGVIPHTVELQPTELENTGIRLLREAFQLSQFDQTPLALERAKVAVQLIPDSPDAWALLGGLYLNSEQVSEGIRALETSKRLNAENAGVHFSLGSAYFLQGNYERSRETIEAGLKLKSDTADPYFDLGNAYYKLGNYRQAIKRYQKALDLDAKLWPAVNNIGLVQYEDGDPKAAIESWKSAIAIDDKVSEPKLALGIALYIQGQQEQGVSLVEEALAIDKRYGDEAFLIENLWGERLLADARTIFNTPKIRAAIDANAIPEPTPAP